ncbi:Protein of unknown function, partial [Gryllus bimaculatus]
MSSDRIHVQWLLTIDKKLVFFPKLLWFKKNNESSLVQIIRTPSCYYITVIFIIKSGTNSSYADWPIKTPFSSVPIYKLVDVFLVEYFNQY